MNFALYKPMLRDFLIANGADVHEGLCLCFNPGHNETEGSCQIDEKKFHCYGCGIDGDIYDAVRILKGIDSREEQYKYVENFFGNGSKNISAVAHASAPEKENFTANPACCEKLEKYLNGFSTAKKEISNFLDTRAKNSTYGKILEYPAAIKNNLLQYFYYWPGFDIASREIGFDTLRGAGIPLVNRKTGKSSWDHSGVIIKLATGYKLHFYQSGDVDNTGKMVCEKRGSKCCHTFPMPGLIDPQQPVILVEGEMDAVSSAAAGVKNIFFCGGTGGLTKPKVKASLLSCHEVIIFFDADDPGRVASGLDPIPVNDKRQTNIPDTLLDAGFAGKIKIANLGKGSDYKDQDAAVVAGRSDLLFNAIQNAIEYIKTPKTIHPADGWESFDPIPLKKLKSLLNKVNIDDIDPDDVQPFVSACVKSCTDSGTYKELLEWGAKEEQLKCQDGKTPYYLLEFCDKYSLSKYMRRELEKALVPESELLKRIHAQKTVVNIDYKMMEQNDNATQFVATKGIRSAALLVSDVLHNKLIFNECEKKNYIFNGHVWQREPDVAGIVYVILMSVLRYFLEHKIGGKDRIYDLIQLVESRRFRVELVQDLNALPGIFHESVLFDGPGVMETLTLMDGVIDFSGKTIVYRKSRPEEYRRDKLPYTVDQVKNSKDPKKFLEFMSGNFKNKDTLETLMYYLSIIPGRNTQFKCGGFFIGITHTGKTQTLELMKRVYPGMFVSFPSDIITAKNRNRTANTGATPEIASMEGKGAAVASEIDRGAYLNAAMWKEFTGGDTMTARALYQAPHDFIPTAQFIISTNYLPTFDGHDSAVVDRMVVVPFSVQHEKGRDGTKTPEEIKNEITPDHPGIVRLLAEYYIKLKTEYRSNIPLSNECKAYKNRYIQGQETDIDKFVNDCVDFDFSGGVYTPIQTVYESFLNYFDFSQDDRAVISRNKFTHTIKKDFNEIEYKQKKINGEPVLCFFNMKLKPDNGKKGQPDLEPRNIASSNDSYENPPEPDDMPF